MALKICSFDALVADDFSVGTGLIASPTTRFLLPSNQNVLIKKIAVSCTSDSPNTDLILDWSFKLSLINENNTGYQFNRPLLIGGVISGAFNTEIQTIDKSNPCLDLNVLAGGFTMYNFYFCWVKFYTAPTTTSNLINFKVSIYYD
jgi:hypothetical protein